MHPPVVSIHPDRKSGAKIGITTAHPVPHSRTTSYATWTIDEWLLFDYRAGWGTEAFEEKIDDGEIEVEFPEAWEDVADREEAREIVDANLEKIEEKAALRKQVMENGSRIDGPVFDGALAGGGTPAWGMRVRRRVWAGNGERRTGR